MKALITAGGQGTRLRPITYTINKHLFPIANKPMLFHALEKVAKAGIKDIAININEGDKELPAVVGEGKQFGVKITYIEQKGGPLGLAHIIANAKKWIGREDLLFYLGDNIVAGDLKSLIDKFYREKLDCLLTLSRVRDPERFGVPAIKKGRITAVEEKPQKPKSSFAVTGIYLYRPAILEAVNNIKPSSRGEYEISDAHSYLIKKGYRVGYEEITGWWKDTGKPEDLLEGNGLILSALRQSEIPFKKLESGWRIEGAVEIGRGTKLKGEIVIRGPVVIGSNCLLEDACIDPYTSIGDGVVIKKTEISHSIICEGTQILECGVRIVDSLLGKNSVVKAEDATLPSGHKLVIGDNAQVEL
ncbi:MAG: glucose-1-phosphate thymidylyltransferase [Candidatus Moranbacteria bacterium]|nr:glucose-1-phosphate thymidylyltransferase [Candidatus Moranbacteria bacterium]